MFAITPRVRSPLALCSSVRPAARRPSSTTVRAAAPDPVPPAQEPIKAPAADSRVNTVTGNPQTGKLIDVYFEVGAFLVIVAVAFFSLWNVQDVVNQTSSADSLRQPAPRAEWAMMDNQDVYGPCGGSQDSSAAMEDLVEGRACNPGEYSRAVPKEQLGL